MNLENKVKNRFNISEILKKLLFRVSKLEKNFNVPNSYSTDEIKTGGTWIDGKPIYRKVIPFTLPDGIVSQTFVLDLSTLNAEIVIKNEAKLFNDDDQWIDEQLIFNGGFAYHFFSKIVFPNLIEIAYLSTFLSTGDTTSIQNNMSGKIILEYTKTTD